MAENTGANVVENVQVDRVIENPPVLDANNEIITSVDDLDFAETFAAPTANKEATAVLTVHRGARKVSLAELENCYTPPATATHKPVKHFDLIMGLMNTLKSKGVNITKSEFALSKGDQMLFAILVTSIKCNDGDFAAAMGIQAANDKTSSIKINTGGRVFVCDNMAFCGETTVLRQPHVKEFDIVYSTEYAVKSMARHFKLLQNTTQLWKQRKVSELEAFQTAYALTFNPAEENQKLLPQKLFAPTMEEFLHPQHDYRYPQSAWGLHNAFTFACKELEPAPQQQCLLQVSKYFNTHFGQAA